LQAWLANYNLKTSNKILNLYKMDITKYLYNVKCNEKSWLGWLEQRVLELLFWTQLIHTKDNNFLAPKITTNYKVFNILWPVRILWHYRKDDGTISDAPTNNITYDFYIIPLLQIPIGGLRKDYLTVHNNGNITAIGTILFGLFSFEFTLTHT
jgi:hypothetical protein